MMTNTDIIIRTGADLSTIGDDLDIYTKKPRQVFRKAGTYRGSM